MAMDQIRGFQRGAPGGWRDGGQGRRDAGAEVDHGDHGFRAGPVARGECGAFGWRLDTCDAAARRQREAQQADLFNRLMAGAGMGLNAASMQGTAGQNYVSQASNAFNQAAAAQAGGATSGFNTLMGLGGTFIGAGGLPGLSKLF